MREGKKSAGQVSCTPQLGLQWRCAGHNLGPTHEDAFWKQYFEMSKKIELKFSMNISTFYIYTSSTQVHAKSTYAQLFDFFDISNAI